MQKQKYELMPVFGFLQQELHGKRVELDSKQIAPEVRDVGADGWNPSTKHKYEFYFWRAFLFKNHDKKRCSTHSFLKASSQWIS